MYQIYADNTLIYDSTIEDYKISKGLVTLETNKSGSFVFGVYSDHFYYDRFIRLKTVITVYKAGKIKFRGRILNDITDFWNNKVITCEGELGFLNDSIIRPFVFSGTPEELFVRFIEEHNSQVDDFKKFKIGTVTVIDPNNYISRSNSNYETAFSNMNSRLIEDSLGGYFYITHGDDGTDPIPTIHYLADFTNVSTQKIEFGENLKNYTKTVKAETIATAIIPLGGAIDDGNADTDDPKLTIKDVNAGVDYVYDTNAVALYGWIFKVMEWNDVTTAEALKRKAEEYLRESINQNITIEVNAIDLHLLDNSIETFEVCQYITVSSEPHNFEATLLCNKQTIDLLKPDNDSLTLGYTYSTFTEYANKSMDNSLTVVKLDIDRAVNNAKKELNNAIEDAKEELEEEITNQDLATQRLTALMAQSLGVFKSEEVLADGSVVYYMHDNQLLSKSKVIWKMTANAFAVSTDGGKTWNAGLDAEGNAVVNLLSVVGLTAEWIKTGLIKSLDGSSWWNLDTGEMSLKSYSQTDDIVSVINQSPEGIELKGNRVVIESDNFTLSEIGEILAKSGEIGGWGIDVDKFETTVVDPNNANHIYRIVLRPPIKTDIDNTVVFALYKSTNGGATWTQPISFISDGRARIGNVSIGTNNSVIIWKDDGSMGVKLDKDSLYFYENNSSIAGLYRNTTGGMNLSGVTIV